MSGFTALYAKQMYRFVRSPMEMMSTLFMPLILVGLFGVGMASALGRVAGGLAGGATVGGLAGAGMTSGGAGAGFGAAYLAFMTPGAAALTVLSSSVVGGATLLQERLNGVIRQYLVAPIPRLAILAGSVSSSVTKAVGQAVLIVLLAAVLGAHMQLQGPATLAAMAGTLAFAIGFAGLSAYFASITSTMGAYHAVINIFNVPLLFASNALYPLSVLPGWLRALALLNPTSYAVELVRLATGAGAPELLGVAGDLAVLAGFGAAGLMVGLKGVRLWATPL
ncbi:ABC transporter permease [Carboxydochorda subterranea]|uniref:Transport permease protein n=1 Tax=Carboxydichorda subterranea TaxID=3109565 RepID=A0ABZ1BXA4_9FIRM|nr:ABC transporter permease [Limnochorda sp. L945t]WRP17426.1 ABC transporter permease [Limnochorda sp. L945t]